jgi:hypothetical protein
LRCCWSPRRAGSVVGDLGQQSGGAHDALGALEEREEDLASRWARIAPAIWLVSWLICRTIGEAGDGGAARFGFELAGGGYRGAAQPRGRQADRASSAVVDPDDRNRVGSWVERV